MKTEIRRWLAWGSGAGIEIGAQNLEVAIVRVRPSGVSLAGLATVENFRSRPAAQWGAELLAWIGKAGGAHLAVNAVLPRQDVIVRLISLPGVADKDLAAAVQYQIDSLHPFGEEEALYSWARAGESGAVLVGITRRSVIEEYGALFSEAGLKVGGFTFSAAVLYSALRIPAAPPQPGFLAASAAGGEIEIYGESEARPVFSTTFDASLERAVAFASAELRLASEPAPMSLAELLPQPVVTSGESLDPSRLNASGIAYAAALSGACPWLALNGNLLPAEQRRASSRARLIPTLALASLLLVLAVALSAYSGYQDGRYLKVLEGEVRKLEPYARRSETIDLAAAAARNRTHLLDEVRRRTKTDIDALNELTNLLPPPAWLSSLELTRTGVQLGGEAEQAAELLKKLDASPLFQSSEFTLPIARVGAAAEAFRIRCAREGSPQ